MVALVGSDLWAGLEELPVPRTGVPALPGDGSLPIACPVDAFDDAQVPWWLVGMLELEWGSLMWKVREQRLRGVKRWSDDPGNDGADRKWDPLYRLAWSSVVGWALRWPGDMGLPSDRSWWRRHMPARMRRAALSSPRVFVDACELSGDDNLPIVLADFHVRAVNLMRQESRCLVLLPYEHGKSYLSSVLIPLMDWCEEREATQLRIYYTHDFTVKWTRKLMRLVDGGAPGVSELFPWVRKPMTANQKERLPAPLMDDDGEDDPCHGYWSTDGFSIGGKRVPDYSFRPKTAKAGQVGDRADRVGVDDIVTPKNAVSPKEQDTLDDYLRQAVETMPAANRRRESRFGTQWGTLFQVGTLFAPQDVNSRRYLEWVADPKAKVRRWDIFPKRGSEERGEVLWPAKRDFEAVLRMREVMGRDAFDMRCRNIPRARGAFMFDRQAVENAVSHTHAYGVPPGQMPAPVSWSPRRDPHPLRPGNQVSLLIGFDPAKGKRGRYSKNPAAAVLAFATDAQGTERMHIVWWQRWRGVNQYEQTRLLDELARRHQCFVAFEDNYDADIYREEAGRKYPELAARLVNHRTTKENKREPEDGVPSFIGLFERQLIVIHGQGAPPEELRALVEEFAYWPAWTYSDLVMAIWVGAFQHRLRRRSAIETTRLPVPDYASSRGLGGVIDLRPFKGGPTV